MSGRNIEREFSIRLFHDDDLEPVRTLWEACGLIVPHNDPVRDIAFCRASPTAELFVGVADGGVKATAMTGHDGHRGWLYYVAVDPAHRGRGWGREMVGHAESWLRTWGVPKINLMIRESNAVARGFYDAIGYDAEPRVVMARFLDPGE